MNNYIGNYISSCGYGIMLDFSPLNKLEETYMRTIFFSEFVPFLEAFEYCKNQGKIQKLMFTCQYCRVRCGRKKMFCDGPFPKLFKMHISLISGFY